MFYVNCKESPCPGKCQGFGAYYLHKFLFVPCEKNYDTVKIGNDNVTEPGSC